MTAEIWDCIVIGSGVIGLSTAYQLTKAGLKTLILEQFHIPHTRGSSHGQSRLIRKCHADDIMAEMVLASYGLWEEIERESNKQLMIKTGLVLLQDKDAEDIKETKRVMTRQNLDHEWLTGADIKQRYPMISYSESYKGVLDKSAAILKSDVCLRVLANIVESNGGIIRDGVRVTRIIPGSLVRVQSSSEEFVAKKVVVAAGPWSKDVLATVGIDLPIKTMPGLVCYWKCTSPLTTYDVKSFPSILEDPGKAGRHYQMVYAMPSSEYPGLVKVVTRGEPPPFYCHPDDRDRRSSQPMIDLLSNYIKRHFPGLETQPSILEPCMYSMTPDKTAIIDRHPQHSNIIIGTGFSGKGFMLAPVAGKILTDLVQDIQPQWNMSNFSLRRFKTASKL